MAFSLFSFVVSEFALAESDLLWPYTNEAYEIGYDEWS